MKLLFLPPVLSLVYSLSPTTLHECDGCLDTSDPASVVQVQAGSCVAITTVYVEAWSGECIPYEYGCAFIPCTPTLSIHSQSSNAEGVRIAGGIENLTFGPLRVTSGNDVEVYRSTVAIKCGGDADYFFYVTAMCPDTPDIDFVSGTLECSACIPHH